MAVVAEFKVNETVSECHHLLPIWWSAWKVLKKCALPQTQVSF